MCKISSKRFGNLKPIDYFCTTKKETAMKKQTQAIHTRFQSRDAYGSLSMPVYHTAAYEFDKPKLIDLTNTDEVAASVDNDTACIFMEIITNPQMEVADIKALAAIAHAKGIPLVADTTMIPFTQFDAHALGVDIEVVSSTKYLMGELFHF